MSHSGFRVLYVAAECKPFSKVGGVGDVAGELPRALKRSGVDVELAVPWYGAWTTERLGRLNMKPSDWKSETLEVKFGKRKETVTVYRGKFYPEDVWVNFFVNATYFESEQVYIHSDDIPFKDDIQRFSFFSEACLRFIQRYEPDIVHINDWVLGYLFGRMVMEGCAAKRVLTIHNIGYQGNIAKHQIRAWPIEEIYEDDRVGKFFEDPRWHWQSVNPLRLGMELAHGVSTVSPNYCEEIRKPENPWAFFEGGKGLEQTAERLYEQGRLVGILNGFQYEEEPSEEGYKKILAKKKKQKKGLAHRFAEPEAFLIGFVGRAVEQKFKLLTEVLEGLPVLEHLLNIPHVNIAVLGTGLPEYERFLFKLATQRFPQSLSYNDYLAYPVRSNFSFTVAFDRSMAQAISLGSDAFLMPSLFEPCGITQMESMACATPPLVRFTGGLTDTVVPFPRNGATGFGFEGAYRDDILRRFIDTVRLASEVYYSQKSGYEELQWNGYFTRFSWEKSAVEYVEKLYRPSLACVHELDA